MSLADDLASLDTTGTEATLEPRPPQGWTPGIVWDGKAGTITTPPLDAPPDDWSALLAARGMDPERYEIVGDTIRWCSYDGWRRDDPDSPAYSAQCFSFKAEIRLRRGADEADAIDLEALAAEIRKTRPKKRPVPAGDGTWVVCLSDWQVGNRDAGGLRAQLEAIAALPALLTAQLKHVRKARPVGHIVIAGLGDLVEGCSGYYSTQTFSVEANRRTQMRVVRRGVYEIVKVLAPLAERMTLTAVAGNHGENRQGGKLVTDVADNDDVAVFEAIAERLAENPDVYGHVACRLPEDRLAVSVECDGHLVAFTHGHIARPRGIPINTIWEWWTTQAMGRRYPGVADASVLIAGHYHHLGIRVQQNRALAIAPSLSAVGDWWGDATGYTTSPGTLTFWMGPEGWANIEVVR
jgi:hypothetical protein